MTQFTVGDKVVHHRVPQKVFEVDWVEGKLVGCLKITNGNNIESHVFVDKSLELVQQEVSARPLNTLYDNPTQ